MRYVLSVTFCGAIVMKVIDLKTLVQSTDTFSFALTGIRLGPKQARLVNDSTASLSLAE